MPRSGKYLLLTLLLVSALAGPVSTQDISATSIQPLSTDPRTNLYDKSSLVPGISCESCHGPGAAHIAAQKHTDATSTILNPAHFSRDRQIAACTLCHNGTARRQLATAFSYTPGEPLDRFLAPAPLDAADTHPDVHGNRKPA